MGGDIRTPPGSDTGEDSSTLDQDSSQLSSPLFRNGLMMNADDARVERQKGLVLGEHDRVDCRFSSASSDFEANQRRRENVHRKILLSNEELLNRSKYLEDAKSKILSYAPGAWIESVGGVKLRDYDVPKKTTLLLVGPKGSGKSSLVNRISKVFEDDKFASGRAQVSYNSSVGDGTFFLQEYTIPRCSNSFCLYDTRGLSDDSLENINILQQWMENGVRNGELVIRVSDSQSLRTTMMCKARDNGYLSSEIRKVNFVIFVVNGLSVLKSAESDKDAEARYTQMLASAFNCPHLAFKDDKPVVVVTHGDLLSPDERARVHVLLGELLGIPPTTQIFDIPESSDPVTDLTIVDMLRYSLEHAEKNLPHKRKVHTVSAVPGMLLLIILGIVINVWCMHHHAYIQHGSFPSSEPPHIQHCPSPHMHIQHSHGPSPEADAVHHNPLPPSPQAYIQHGPSPHVQTHHAPSSPQAYIQRGPSPQAHIHGDPSSPQEHIHHDPSSPQEHIYHGPLPKEKPQKRGGLSIIKAKIDKIRIDWSKIRHLWLDE